MSAALVQTSTRVNAPVGEYEPTDADWDAFAAWDTYDHDVRTGVDSPAPRVNRKRVR